MMAFFIAAYGRFFTGVGPEGSISVLNYIGVAVILVM